MLSPPQRWRKFGCPLKALKIIALVLIVLVGIAIVLAGAYIERYGPPTDTEEWQRLSKHAKHEIERIVPPLPGEKYLYFYSLGVANFSEDGNLITDQRVVSYSEEEGELFLAEARYADITDISVQQGKSFLDDTVITVHHDDEYDDFDLWFSVKGKIDRRIVAYIRERIRARASTSAPTSATPGGSQGNDPLDVEPELHVEAADDDSERH